MITGIKRLASKFIRDKNNNIVIWQSPNLPLFGWFIFMIMAYLAPSEFFKTGFTDLSRTFLFVWSYLEIAQGSSYFRRLVGVIIMLVILVGIFS
ncbi:hypothetical protein H7X68_03950 [Candidatus Saccharibacteria bacterium]|nr:hypothetical protein [Candidatus Saccharibacteria bacterium]